MRKNINILHLAFADMTRHDNPLTNIEIPDPTHPAAAIMEKSQKVDPAEWAAAQKSDALTLKSLANKNFVVEAQDDNVDLSEVPGGQIRFQNARNSVKLTKEEMQKAREFVAKQSKGDYQIEKVEVKEEVRIVTGEEERSE